MSSKKSKPTTTDPPILLAILLAARQTNDEILECVAKRELERLGIVVDFVAPRRESEVRHE